MRASPRWRPIMISLNKLAFDLISINKAATSIKIKLIFSSGCRLIQRREGGGGGVKTDKSNLVFDQ